MTEEEPRHLSTVQGLTEAGIVDSFVFNPFTGLVEVRYTPNWIRILISDLVLLVDPVFLAAIADDDQLGMRMFVERKANASRPRPHLPQRRRSRTQTGRALTLRRRAVSPDRAKPTTSTRSWPTWA